MDTEVSHPLVQKLAILGRIPPVGQVVLIRPGMARRQHLVNPMPQVPHYLPPERRRVLLTRAHKVIALFLHGFELVEQRHAPAVHPVEHRGRVLVPRPLLPEVIGVGQALLDNGLDARHGDVLAQVGDVVVDDGDGGVEVVIDDVVAREGLHAEGELRPAGFELVEIVEGGEDPAEELVASGDEDVESFLGIRRWRIPRGRRWSRRWWSFIARWSLLLVVLLVLLVAIFFILVVSILRLLLLLVLVLLVLRLLCVRLLVHLLLLSALPAGSLLGEVFVEF